MKKILTLILTIFLIGCGPIQQTQPQVLDIHSGTDGLTIDFLKGHPPTEVEENSFILVSMEIKNEGTSDIQNGVVSLGLDRYVLFDSWQTPDVFNNLGSTTLFNIEGKSTTNPSGGYEIATVKLLTRKLEEQLEVLTSNIIFNACYKYRTDFASQICIDPEPTTLSQKVKVCELQDLSPGSQGAPVAITRVETKMLPTDTRFKVIPQFTFHISNKGNGEVVKQDKVVDVCSPSALSPEYFNVVNFKATLGDIELKCGDGKTEYKTRGRESTIKCTLEEGIERSIDPYQSIIEADIDYGYTFSESRPVRIRRII